MGLLSPCRPFKAVTKDFPDVYIHSAFSFSSPVRRPQCWKGGRGHLPGKPAEERLEDFLPTNPLPPSSQLLVSECHHGSVGPVSSCKMQKRVNKVLHQVELILQLTGQSLLAPLGQEMPASMSHWVDRVEREGLRKQIHPPPFFKATPSQKTRSLQSEKATPFLISFELKNTLMLSSRPCCLKLFQIFQDEQLKFGNQDHFYCNLEVFFKCA